MSFFAFMLRHRLYRKTSAVNVKGSVEVGRRVRYEAKADSGTSARDVSVERQREKQCDSEGHGASLSFNLSTTREKRAIRGYSQALPLFPAKS